MLAAKNPLPLRLRAILRGIFFCGVTGVCALAAVESAAVDGAAGGIAAKPLGPHPFPRGTTMFGLRSPAVTGVVTENRYADPEMWGKMYPEFEGGSLGTGVAIGDFDGDGRPDIFVVSKTETCRLFRNLGGFKFADVTVAAGVGDQGEAAGIWKQGATFVDVNNDGRLDIYVCRFNAPNLLYINQGDGTFKEQGHAAGLDVRDASIMAAFCDYDRDGWLDVYLVTNLADSTSHPSGQRGRMFHNNRDGTFQEVTDQAGISGEAQSHSATWWDYDNDGWPDLYVANDYGVPDKLYHNNRDGTFTNTLDRVLPHTTFYSMGSDTADVNNDGLIDLFVADMAATTHEKDQRGVADARGRTEEVENSPAAPKAHRSALLLNTGMNRCLEAAYLAGIAASDWTWSVRFEDLDNDGHVDLAVTNGYNRDPSVDVASRMRSAESPAERIRIMHDSPELPETHLGFRNLGDLQFQNVSKEWGLDQKGVSFGAAFGDLGGDGNLSLVYSNYERGATVLSNDNDTGHRVDLDLRGTVSNRFGVGATVRIESSLGLQVSQLALARGYMSSSEPMIHFGLGADTVVTRLTVNWPSGHVQTFENLPVDQRFTITEPATPIRPPDVAAPVVASEFTEVSRTTGLALRSHEEPVNEVSIQPLLPVRLNRRGPSVAVAEQASGDTLLAVGGTTQSPLRLMRGGVHGFSNLDTAALLPIGLVNDGPLLLFDADGDGDDDLLVTKGGNSLLAGSLEYQPHLYRGDGQGGFERAPEDALPALPISVGAAAAADWDQDGRLDLFIGGRVQTGEYPLPPSSALLINRGGKFEDVTDAIAPGLRRVGMVTAAVWSDVDGDGWPDLVLALEWGQVKYFHNEHGQRFEDWTERSGFASAGTGWWSSLASADFNGDGRPDFVIGNVGLNTQYHADSAHPALLYSGDFKGDGSVELIEGYYEGDKIYPWRSRRALGAVMPSLLKRYPKTDLYARATLGELFGDQKLAKADRLAATELRSGILLSQADGTYRYEALPHLAQIAPLQGTVVGDFDGDGRTDIYAVQNSYAPIPAVGRFDGGLSLLLLGDGHGHFTPAPPAQSGLLVPGDAKGLAVLDLNDDAWPDFFVTRNNDSTLAFQNGSRRGHHPLKITLHGPKGNRTAIGSRLTLEHADGATETVEIQAGSGYYSQSAAAAFFGYTEANPPKQLRIRWPSGATSAHLIPRDATTLAFSVPEAPR
jgi:hypothetical protein